MFEISISPELLETHVEEILKRIEHAGDPAVKEYEADIAWFQIFYVHKLITMGAEIHFAIIGKKNQESLVEYQCIKEMMNAALQKVEELYESSQGTASQS